MLYEVRVSDTFHASHAVRMPDGAMEAVHWHAWGVEVVFEGADVDADGLLVDFEIVRRSLREILQPLEGAYLNDHAFMGAAPASAEHVARCIWRQLSGAREWAPARLAQVFVREAAGCVAGYRGSGGRVV